MSVGPGEGISVPIIADTSAFAAELASKLEAAVGSVSGEVFAPLVAEAEVSGAKAGAALAAGFTVDANGRIRNARGQFVATGEQTGLALAEGMTLGTQTVLPKFAAEGEKAGHAFGAGLGEGSVEAFKSFAGPLLAIFAAEKVGEFFKDAITDASAAQKAIETASQFFGRGFASIEEHAASADTAIGLSEQGYLQAARTLGALGKRAGLTGDDLNTFVEDAIQRGGDLSAEFGKSVPDALKALQSGLAGNVRGLRQFGVQITSQDIANEAYASGIAKSGEVLTTQQKILAASELIFKQTDAAQGQFAKHSGDLAQQEAILKAKFENIAEEVGTHLLPVMVELTGALLHVISIGGDVIGFFEHNQIAAVALGAVLGTVLIPHIAGTVVVMGNLAAVAAAQTLRNIGAAALAIIPGMQGAAAATVEEGVALETLDFNPVILGVTALAAAAAGIAIAIAHVHDSYDEIAESGHVLVENLDDQHTSAIRSTQSVAEMVAQLRTLKAQHTDNAAEAFYYQTKIDDLSAAIAEQGGIAGVERTNENALAAQYGLTIEQVDTLARKHKIDLSGALSDVSAQFSDVVSKTTAVNADFISLSDTTQSLSDKIDSLDDAWNRLVGNFISRKQGVIDTKNDLAKLRDALDKSNGSIRLNSQASRDARAALIGYANDIDTNIIDPIIKSGGSYEEAKKAADHWLQGIKDSGASGPLVDNLTRRIEGYLRRLRDASGPLGAQSGGNFSHQLASHLSDGEAAIRAELDKYRGWFAEPLRLAFDFFSSLPSAPDGGGAVHHPGNGGPGNTKLPPSPVSDGPAQHPGLRFGGPTVNVYPNTGDPVAIAQQVANRLAANSVSR